jgi:hypothetical protein
MRAILLVLILASIVTWAALAAQGVIAYLPLEPTGSSFTRGTNRITAFLQWESLALLAAIAAYVLGRIGQVSGAVRLILKTPLWLSGGFFVLLALLFAGAVLYARM